MLSLTPTAAEVVDSIVSNDELPDTAGLRIASEQGDQPSDAGTDGNPTRDLRLSVVEEPEQGDQVIDGSPVFVEPGETAELLDDKVLDADIDGKEVRFSLQHRPGPEG